MYFYMHATIRRKLHAFIIIICVNVDYSNTTPGLVGFFGGGTTLLLRNVTGS